MKQKTLVAITGTIGCGKSSLCKFLEELDCKIVYADEVGHQILPLVKDDLVKEFFESILNCDNEIDKNSLSKLAFSDSEKLNKLNEITHPVILATIEDIIKKQEEDLIFVEIPPVFSRNISDCFDLDVNVETSVDLQIQRLQIKNSSLLSRINSQKNNALITNCNHIVENYGSLQELREKAHELLALCKKITPKRKKPLSSVYLPKICVCVSKSDVQNAKKEIDYIRSLHYLAEFRLDYLNEIPNNLDTWNKRGVIATLRTVKQGGKANLTEEEYKKAILQIDKLGFEFIDIEYDLGKDLDFSELNSKIVLSYHNFAETPKNIVEIISKMEILGTPYLKVATLINNINDNFLLFNALKKFPNLIAFGMGVKGEFSRILSLKYGSPFTYSFLPTGKAVAPGQIDLSTLTDMYGVLNTNENTCVYGLIGKNIEKSFSRAYHNQQFLSKQINACFVNFPIDSGPELEEFLANFKSYGWKGVAITMPFKQEVLPLLNKLDETAQKIGAVNTLKNEKGKLLGFNTDYIGAIKPLSYNCSLAGKKVLLLGNGGAAKAALFGLLKENAKVTIAARSLQKNDELSNIGDFTSCTLEEAEKNCVNFDVVINATSVGMNENKSLVAKFRPEQVVMDMVYQPRKTTMLQLSELQGATVIFGDEMLFAQAFEQEKIWFDN